MYPHRLAQRCTFRITIALIICITLLPIPSVSLLVSGATQGESAAPARKGKPRPGKPEGTFPNLDEIQDESRVQRDAPPPIPSTIRSQKNVGKPWDGRRVGDPEPQ